MSRNDRLLLGLWCAALLALLAPVWARPGLVFFNHGDLYTYHVPLRSLTAAALQSGRLPFWNPYILLGVPHAANPQAALFYPPALLCSLFPVATALTWDQILHLLWAGAGFFLLARSQRLDRAGAAMLASSFALSPFLVYRVTAGIPTLLAALAWTPWLWLAWLADAPLLLTAALALQLLSGHAQFLVINGAAMALWAALRRERRVLLTRLVVAGAGALAMTSIQWALTAQYLRNSVRSSWSGASSPLYALPPRALWTWLGPGALGTPASGDWRGAISEFYETCGGWAGPLALALAAWGVVRGRRRGPALALAAAGVVLALGPGEPLSRAVLGGPILSYLRTPSRWLFLTLWAVLLSAGAGWAAVRRRRLPRGAVLALVAAAFAPMAIWDAQFLRPQDPSPFLAPRPGLAERLEGTPRRVLTDPALANSNKTMLYRWMNVNGYEAFYPKGVPEWAAAAEGAPAADASRVEVTRWRSEAAMRAGVSARLSAEGLETGPAWPLAAFVDARGERRAPDPRVFVAVPERWHVRGTVPPGAVALEIAVPDYPGWRATVGGTPVPTRRWNGVFQAIVLPVDAAGSILVASLDFVPTGWTWLAAATASAWAAWLAALTRRASETA